jgi:hypothetical protein
MPAATVAFNVARDSIDVTDMAVHAQQSVTACAMRESLRTTGGLAAHSACTAKSKQHAKLHTLDTVNIQSQLHARLHHAAATCNITSNCINGC